MPQYDQYIFQRCPANHKQHIEAVAEAYCSLRPFTFFNDRGYAKTFYFDAEIYFKQFAGVKWPICVN